MAKAPKTTATADRAPEDFNPAEYKLTERQADRLADVSGLPAKQLAGLTVADISKRFPFQVEPSLLFFRRICGRVVKTDPVTGVQLPVPGATVQIEDTDCSFLGYYPPGSPWSWLFPFGCRREVIATTVTDACGNFCVRVPRFDIDWILRWRLERICYPVIFQRPNLGELIEELIPFPWPPEPDPGPFPGPRPGPDPSPLDRLPDLKSAPVRARLSDALGTATLQQLDALQDAPFGAKGEGAELLEQPAFKSEQPAPLPRELQLALERSPKEATKELIGRLGLDRKELIDLDLRHVYGPFRRCYTRFVPEWQPVIDVPDLTFRVLQDVNGDGVKEQIYGESYFDVRWNAGSVPFTVIEAGPLARAGVACGPENVPCGDKPAIVLAGRLPVLSAPIYDAAEGYSRVTNRPHPSGIEAETLPIPAGRAPLQGTVALYGCNGTEPGATRYRLLYEYSSNGGVSYSPPTPFVGLTWPLYRLDGSGNDEWHYPSADADGWYPIELPAGPNPFLPEKLLLDWPTYAFADGRYRITLEVAGPAGPAIDQSAPVTFAIENTRPTGAFTVDWSLTGTGGWQPLQGPCPIVRRGVTPSTVFFRVRLDASAGHLRSATMNASSCGLGSMEFQSGSGGAQTAPGSTAFEHWHTNVLDNSQSLEVIYRLPATTGQGTYGFNGTVSSRSFSPLGADGGHLVTPPWQYDPAPNTIYPSVAFSVINAA